MSYEFTTDWFSKHIPLWKGVLDTYKPARILEVGSYEGRSTVYLIEECSKYADVEIGCIDTWEGGVEHIGTDFNEVERRFGENINRALDKAKENPFSVRVMKIKGESHKGLAELLCEGNAGKFDLVYIDGSHMPTDVLLDATLGFKLTRVGGVMIFDDYRRAEQPELEHPQIAIDCFMVVHERKLQEINFRVKTSEDGEVTETRGGNLLYQKYLLKVAE